MVVATSAGDAWRASPCCWKLLTPVTQFILLGFSNDQTSQKLLLGGFLLIYVMTSGGQPGDDGAHPPGLPPPPAHVPLSQRHSLSLPIPATPLWSHPGC